jgi:hypothetical protein
MMTTSRLIPSQLESVPTEPTALDSQPGTLQIQRRIRSGTKRFAKPRPARSLRESAAREILSRNQLVVTVASCRILCRNSPSPSFVAHYYPIHILPRERERERERATSFIDPADRFPQPPHHHPCSTAVGIPQHQTELDCLPSPASRLPTPRPTWHPFRARATKRGDRLTASVFPPSRDCRGFGNNSLLSNFARRLRPGFATRTRTPTEDIHWTRLCSAHRTATR